MHPVPIEIRSSAGMLPLLTEFERQMDAAQVRAYHDLDPPEATGDGMDRVDPAPDLQILCLPHTECADQPGMYRMEATLPGFRVGEIKVTVGPQDLMIRAESLHGDSTLTSARVWLKAMSHFRFRHAVDLSAVTAFLAGSVLHIAVPKIIAIKKDAAKSTEARPVLKHAYAAI